MIDYEWWFQVGQEDEAQDKPMRFRQVKGGFVAAGDTPADWSLDDEQEAGQAYYSGRQAARD